LWSLEQHPNVNRVKYPLKNQSNNMKSPKTIPGGNVIAFEIIGGIEAGVIFR
jgi:O-acetylhomoserine/O-acetylserine sulfhydrylase-like pyridoxal-dependent enzyme